MTTKQIEELIINQRAGLNSVEQSSNLEAEIKSLFEKYKDKSITKDEEIVMWMELKNCDRFEAERWTAIMRGEIKLGKTDEGYID